MEYIAIALNDAFKGGRESASLSFSDDYLVCNFNDQEIRIPTNEIELSLGGASQRLIYLKHPSLGFTTLYTTNLQFLKDPALANNATVQGVAEAKQKFRTNNTLSVFAIILAIVGGIAIFFWQKDSIVKSLAEMVSIETENELGDSLFDSVVEEDQLIKDTILIAQITEIAQPIIDQVKDTNYHFKFYIINDPSLNAYALPGGHIVIHTGLINSADSWAQIQGVLAHEVSHVTKRHHVRGVIGNLGTLVLLSAFIGDGSAIMDAIYQYGGQLESLMYSRHFEEEADESGWEYLIAANIDPAGMIQFFEKLDKKPEGNDEESDEKEEDKEDGEDESEDDDTMEELASFLSTHPATKERIERLNEKLEKLGHNDYTQPTIDLEEFKITLNEQL